MAPSSVIGLGQHQEQGDMGILEDLGSGDSPSPRQDEFCSLPRLPQLTAPQAGITAGHIDLTLQESSPPLFPVKSSGGFHSPNLGFKAWPLVVYFIQGSSACLLCCQGLGWHMAPLFCSLARWLLSTAPPLSQLLQQWLLHSLLSPLLFSAQPALLKISKPDTPR